MIIAKGKRGTVYKVFFIAVKIKNKERKALGNIEREGKWLRLLNKHGIGKKVYFTGRNFIVYRIIFGKPVLEYFKDAPRREKLRIVMEVFRQCWILDRLRINKFEMHHPFKHILIGKKIVMIDFERCSYSEKPKNVTQFAQSLNRLGVDIDNDKMVKALKKYKENYNENSFKEILKLVQ